METKMRRVMRYACAVIVMAGLASSCAPRRATSAEPARIVLSNDEEATVTAGPAIVLGTGDGALAAQPTAAASAPSASFSASGAVVASPQPDAPMPMPMPSAEMPAPMPVEAPAPSQEFVGVPPAAPAPVAPAMEAPRGLIDDFNRGQKPNLLGGDFGAWDKDPTDATQFCRLSFDREHAYGGAGYCLQLEYDVDSPNPAYNGFWMKLPNFDASQYQYLTLRVRGDAATGFTAQCKLELKSAQGKGTYVLRGIADEWQQVRIRLNAFAGLSDLSQLTEFVVVFDDVTVNRKTGTIYLDDIAFE